MPLLSGQDQPEYFDSAFSQFPRDGKYMGLSMRTAEWRYTEWLPWDFESGTATSWEPVGIELYDHRRDTGGYGTFDLDSENLAYDPRYAGEQTELSKQLRSTWDVNKEDRRRGRAV